MKQPTKDALRDQLVLAANRIIAQGYDIDLFRWDAEQQRARKLEGLRNDFTNEFVLGPVQGSVQLARRLNWLDRIKAVF